MSLLWIVLWIVRGDLARRLSHWHECISGRGVVPWADMWKEEDMRAFIFVLVAGMLLIPATALATPGSLSFCAPVAGTILAQAVPTATGFDVFYVDATGPLAGHPIGEQLVWVTVQKVTPGGTVHYTSTHVFADTVFGPLTTSDNGVITPTGRFHNTLTVIGGGSGTIAAQGTVDFATGVVDVVYRGHVCGN